VQVNACMLKHLESRHFYVDRYPSVVVGDDRVTFTLWNLSGQMVGYQVYRPNCARVAPCPKDQKYFTYITRQGGVPALAVWGLETVPRMGKLYICEGVFDACRLHNLGLPAIAVLTSNPKHLGGWLKCLPHRKAVVCDGDVAGRSLSKFGDEVVFLDSGRDLGDLTDKEVMEIIYD